jgi:hypothetical protein
MYSNVLVKSPRPIYVEGAHKNCLSHLIIVSHQGVEHCTQKRGQFGRHLTVQQFFFFVVSHFGTVVEQFVGIEVSYAELYSYGFKAR